jgi:hypothetical protein
MLWRPRAVELRRLYRRVPGVDCVSECMPHVRGLRE